MTKHTAFLQEIGANPEDNGLRLVFSDWLDENGDPERAEFIRIQCELASAKLAKERRPALQARERELLDAHRQAWCQALALPSEDVSFERGLIARMRLTEWEDGRVLDPGHAPWLMALTELDLSGLQLGDARLAAFAETTRLPALRKLILSHNGITDVGAAALAKATGLPRLDTVYLFANAVSGRGYDVLERTTGFCLAYLDVGGRNEGYCMSPGEADVARRLYLRAELLPVVSRYFTTYARLQSAMLCVAQYWDDEADDAVHGVLIVSELPEPTLEGALQYADESDSDPNLPTTRIKHDHGLGSRSAISLYETGANWFNNSGAIPLWAAFAPEGGSQHYEQLSEVYAPAVMFYRHGGYELLPMCRPHLDGVQPEWGWEA